MRAASLVVVLVIARLLAIGDRDLDWSIWTPAAYLWHDVLVGFAFWVLDRLTRGSRTLWVLYGAIVALAAIDVPVTRALSSPLTVPMLRAAGAPLLDSFAYYVTPFTVTAMAVVIGAGIAAPVVVRRVPPVVRTAGIAAAVAIAVAGPFAGARVSTFGLHRNAVTALAATALPRIASRAAEAEWRAPLFERAAADDLSTFRGHAARSNVIVVVLESTPAHVLASYGAASDPTPHLSAFARHSLVFDNIYAVYPESVKGIFATLCARDPAFDVAAERHARAGCASLAQILARAGYRTGLFHSGRFAYLGMQAIVDRLGFHAAEDAGAIGGNVESSFGVDEPATVARMLSWIDARPSDQPFFITYLPVAGHHPYATPERAPFPIATEADAHRHALLYGGRSFGALIAGLRARGLADQTLVAVLGDHGEAFGEHGGNYGHSLFIYDENVRVPLVMGFASGKWPAGLQTASDARRVGGVGSVIDVAPTIVDLIGLPADPGHTGQSLLVPRPPVALFFTDYAIGWLGLRDGCWKYMLEVEARRSSLFDVCSDSRESADLAEQHPPRVAAYRARVEHWSSATRDAILAGR
jgi:arylsulfatase A-like enzyme